jgi:hypothetical protein
MSCTDGILLFYDSLLFILSYLDSDNGNPLEEGERWVGWKELMGDKGIRSVTRSWYRWRWIFDVTEALKTLNERWERPRWSSTVKWIPNMQLRPFQPNPPPSSSTFRFSHSLLSFNGFGLTLSAIFVPRAFVSPNVEPFCALFLPSRFIRQLPLVSTQRRHHVHIEVQVEEIKWSETKSGKREQKYVGAGIPLGWSDQMQNLCARDVNWERRALDRTINHSTKATKTKLQQKET